MVDYTEAKRVLIAERRFVQGLQFKQIEKQIDGVNAAGAQTLCKRLQSQYPEATPAELVEHASKRNRHGKPARIEPGSIESTTIREKLRTDYRYFDQHEAANRVFEQLHHEPRPVRKALRELGAQQVHNIAQSREHCVADPVNQKPINRNRTLQRPSLKKLDLDHRKRYLEWILNRPDDTIFICVDETPHDFAGGSGGRVSAPAGEPAYADSDASPFSFMQWAAASGDTRVKRPFKLWQREEEEQITTLARQLKDAIGVLKKYKEYQRHQATIPGTPEYRILELKNEEVRRINAEKAKKKSEGASRFGLLSASLNLKRRTTPGITLKGV